MIDSFGHPKNFKPSKSCSEIVESRNGKAMSVKEESGGIWPRPWAESGVGHHVSGRLEASWARRKNAFVPVHSVIHSPNAGNKVVSASTGRIG